MGLPADQGLAVLYVMVEDWMWRRDLLELLGAKDPGRLDTVLFGRPAGETPRAGTRAADVLELGGEVG